MRPQRGLATCAAFLACIGVAERAHADYLVTGPEDVSTAGVTLPPNTSVGDIEPGVVALDDGTVTLAWLRIPTVSHLGSNTSLLSQTFGASGSGGVTTPSPLPVASMFPTALGVTTNGSEVLAVFAGPTVPGEEVWRAWLISLSRPMRDATQLLPANGNELPAGQNVLSISVPDRLPVATSFEVPFGITTGEPAGRRTLVSSSVNVSGLLAPMGSVSSQRAAGPGAIERVSRVTGLVRGVFFDLDPALRALSVHDVNGSVSQTFATTSTAYPGVGVKANGALFGAVGAETSDTMPALHCRQTTALSTSSTVVPCPNPAVFVDEIVVATDTALADAMWIVGTSRNAAVVFVGSTNPADVPINIPLMGFSGCSHPAVVAFRGPAARPGRIAVAATCTPSAGGAAHVLRWIVERPMPLVDAAVDAATDASSLDTGLVASDAAPMTDAAMIGRDSGSVDAALSADSAADDANVPGRNGPSFRGGGCACRANPTRPAPDSWVCAGVLLAVAFVQRRGRRGRPTH